MSTITETDMQAKLMSVEEFRQVLHSTENLSSQKLSMDGTKTVLFNLPPGWNIGLKDKDALDLTEAQVAINDDVLTLTKGAALDIAHAVGLTPAYVSKTPGVLIQSHMNYWASHAPEVAFKLLTKEQTVMSVTKETIKPFSNIALLDKTVEVIEEHFDIEETELFIDYKSHHDLNATNARIIIPASVRSMKEGDDWSGGIQFSNSIVGTKPLTVNGYLFRWACTNGAIMQHAAGRYNRKTMGQDEFEVYDWVGKSVQAVIDNMEHEFDVVQSLTEESIQDSATKILVDIFKTYKVPLAVRNKVLENYEHAGDYTYYGVINALTLTANDDALPEHFVTTILEIAGDIAAHAHERCNECKRVFS